MQTSHERRTPPEASPLLLSIRGLEKAHGTTRIVKGIDLDIPERAFTTLLGPSGCGKTTILRTIAGFEKPDAGKLILDGTELAGIPPELRPVNTVFQSYALFPHLTVAENVAFSLRLRRIPDDVDKRVKRALDVVHMGDFASRYPSQLSGGQQQRVAVARAFVAEPRLLLLDEPLSALDAKMRAHLQTELKELQRRLGIAFIYVTHDQEEAFALSDIIVVMNKGKVIQRADPQTLYSRPADSFVADFIGNASLLPGRVINVIGREAVIETVIGKVQAPAVEDLVTGAQAMLVIRPPHIRRSDSPLSFSATVTQVIYQGERSMVEANAAGVSIRYSDQNPPAIGETLRLCLDSPRCFITRLAS